MKRELPSECGGCGLEERWLFHHVSVRNTYRRLCTSCVLKLHSGSFCPICFEVYGSTPPVLRSVCSRCPSVTHLHCVTNQDPLCYVCPPCSNPNFTFFNTASGAQIVDESTAKVLVAAAQIAYVTMSKAASEMRAESRRKVEEAALKRKEAKNSLKLLAELVSSEKKAREVAVLANGVSPISVVLPPVAGAGAVSSAAAMQQRLEKMLAIEANTPTPTTGNPQLALLQNNAVAVHEKQENGGLYSGNVQRLQNGPKTDGPGSSKNGHHIAQPHQDSLLNKSGGVHLGSSNMAR